jgi:hypothetical protein
VKDALEACADEVAFRRGVGNGAADGLVDLLAEQLEPGRVEQRRRRRFLDSRRPILEDGLSQLSALERLDTRTRLERRETVIADLEEWSGGLALVFQGKEVRFPAHAAPELQACFESEEPFGITDLAGDLDVEGRLVLVRRLVREGFLRITG